MKILIIGAGITGISAAFWLSKLGHDVTVVERGPALRTAGLQIDLRNHGITVLRQMGLDEAFRSKAVEESGVQVVDSSGRRRAWFPAKKGTASFTSEYEIMRGDLVQLLYDATKDRARFLFGVSVEAFEEGDDVLQVHLTDGTTSRYDLLVGADGQHSRVRKLMGLDGLIPLNMTVAYYTVAKPAENEESMGTAYVGTANRTILLRGKSQELHVLIGCATDNEHMRHVRRGDVEAEKQAFQKIYKGAGWRTEELVQAAEESDNFYCERIGVVKLDSWFKGRVVLVGDAAYAPSVNTGMGTTSGIVGAYILAGEIGKHCGPTPTGAQVAAALRTYDEIFRPFMDHVQEGVVEDPGPNLPTSAIGIFIMHLFLGAASLFKVNLLSRFIKPPPKGWKLPEY